jgi:PAS domain S-box-containing protein
LSTLASQTAVAISTSRAFMSAEIGRQRLAGILASSPDPILVTDQHNHLILANMAASQILGLHVEPEMEYPIERVIANKELQNLLRDTSIENKSVEISMGKGQIYLGAVSNLVADGQRIGRVCVLRDITRFKELDTLKSEFVSTVSHDLRTPLSLVRGYATMLEMVGQLNEQQTSYVQKIVGGVDSMTHLVNNLLDLGRVEAGVGLQLEMVSASDIADRAVANQR